jgi:large subunit ribosomal protein L21
MLAVVEINKKQYLVKEGDSLVTERLKNPAGKVVFDKILVLADENNIKIGTPYLEKVKVEAEVQGEKKSDKIIIYKFKRRKKHRKKQGHRQIYTSIKITRISAASK